MILVYLNGSKFPNLEYDSLEGIEERLVSFHYDFERYFDGVEKITDEDDNIINIDLKALNSNVEDELESRNKGIDESKELLSDYLRSVL